MYDFFFAICNTRDVKFFNKIYRTSVFKILQQLKKVRILVHNVRYELSHASSTVIIDSKKCILIG